MYGDEVRGPYFGVSGGREAGAEIDFSGVSHEVRLESSLAYEYETR
jgi:hypothetical protein